MFPMVTTVILSALSCDGMLDVRSLLIDVHVCVYEKVFKFR